MKRKGTDVAAWISIMSQRSVPHLQKGESSSAGPSRVSVALSRVDKVGQGGADVGALVSDSV